ncbi:hypothetical protein D3C85_1609970 [compost metagenome]
MRDVFSLQASTPLGTAELFKSCAQKLDQQLLMLDAHFTIAIERVLEQVRTFDGIRQPLPKLLG